MKNIFSGAMSGALALSFLMTALGSYAHGDQAKLVFTKHFKESLFDVTKKAEFSVEILLDDKEYKIGKDVIGIVVHNSHNQDVEKADITIDFSNADTGELAAQTPVVKEKGRGLYIVSNLDIKKDGRWKLTITVRKDGLEDSAQFLFPEVLKNRWPAGKYNP